MARQHIRDLVALLAVSAVPTDVADGIIDEEIRQLPSDLLTTAELTQLAAEQELVDVRRFNRVDRANYNRTSLTVASEAEIRVSHGESWRSRIGHPRALVRDEESKGDLRLFPRPQLATQFNPASIWAPLGEGFEPTALLLFATVREGEVPRWLDLYFALRIIGKFFGQESEVKDVQMAEVCLGWAAALRPFLLRVR